MHIGKASLGFSVLALMPAVASAASFNPAVRGSAPHDPASKLLETRVSGQTSNGNPVTSAATVINFNNLAEGAVLSNQYAGLGVTFSPDPAIASGTDMHATSATTGDVGTLGTPSLVGGMVIHTLSGWNNETDDPNILADFTSPQGFVSVDFASNSTASTVPSEIDLYDSAFTLIGFAVANPAGQANPYQQTVSFTSPSNNISHVVIWPGEFNDWVAWDNFTFNAVPEPASLSVLALGALVMRRRR
jgi:hypothetical protein